MTRTYPIEDSDNRRMASLDFEFEIALVDGEMVARDLKPETGRPVYENDGPKDTVEPEIDKSHFWEKPETKKWNRTSTHKKKVKPKIVNGYDPSLTMTLGDCEILAKRYGEPEFREYRDNVCSLCEKNGGDMPACKDYKPFKLE